MIKLALLLVSIASYGVELIYVSDNPASQNLQSLNEKYKQPLLVNGSRIYLVPKACQLERYFGGASQGEVIQAPMPVQTETIPMTQEVFEAKDQQTVREKIEVEKSIALVEGKVSKAFLEDKEGRGFGGASEMPLDLALQKNEMIHPAEYKTSAQKDISVHPGCHVLDNGSGYVLENANGAQFYSNNVFTPIVNDTIVFK